MPKAPFDPADWSSLRKIAHDMVDSMLDDLSTLRDQPAWRTPDPAAMNRIDSEPLPRGGQGEGATFQQFLSDVAPYRMGNIHPRFFGWVQGNGMPLGALADMLASGLNPHLAGFNQAPRHVEFKVLDWLKELLGYPATASGILLSGGSMANLTGLAVARQAKAGYDVRANGLQAGQPKLRVYCSDETHNWSRKAMELLGFGSDNLVSVPLDAEGRLDPPELLQAIRSDKSDGHRPVCILATAGSVNTGAVDDLHTLADIAASENLWLHVDGAFGALAAASPKTKHLVDGMERADSIAFDLHKWMYLPFEIACLLVRYADAHRATFATTAAYLAVTERGAIAGGLPFSELGFELTRSFKALKAWMCLKAYGADAFADAIATNVEQAAYLAKLVDESPLLERVAPVHMNIVCFRFVGGDGDPDKVNEEILLRLQERGIAVPSTTVVDGKLVIRCCIVNYRTTDEDLVILRDAVVQLGQEIVEERRASLATL